MPNLHRPASTLTKIEFVAPPSLDLLNAMYFTFLAGDSEGVGDWPVETRKRMDPALLAELDLLFTYPRGDPGILGALCDTNFSQRQTWASVDALLAYVRELPAAGTSTIGGPGIQGLAAYALRWPCDAGTMPERVPAELSRESFAAAIEGGDLEPGRAMALFDAPEEVRARMMRTIRRFYDEHYRADEERRSACMLRSIEAHRARAVGMDPEAMMSELAGRHISCAPESPVPYSEYIFVPSVDVGAYVSCADTAPVHGMFYRCEAEFTGQASNDERTARMALVYKALGDEQRLRILRLLRDGEMYAQQIVEATGLHQSVVSRHLTFMKAVGLVVSRRQNNMKFFSLNAAMREELGSIADIFAAAPARA